MTCDARSLAEIRVSVDRKNSSSSLALCITSRDRHQLLLPTFWGENELRRIPMRLHVHMRLHMRLACAHVPDPIFVTFFFLCRSTDYSADGKVGSVIVAA